ncbi:RIP metalloprotease RseP [Sesbania bispinosa]|nr:RIP metalloprotease RseP [Sesbania bispinosa]
MHDQTHVEGIDPWSDNHCGRKFLRASLNGGRRRWLHHVTRRPRVSLCYVVRASAVRIGRKEEPLVEEGEDEGAIHRRTNWKKRRTSIRKREDECPVHQKKN